MKTKICIMLFVNVMILNGCFVPARKVYIFETEFDSGIWLHGRKLVKLEQDSLEIIINFDRTLNGIVLFDVALSNNSNDKYLIDPTRYFCLTTDKFQQVDSIHAENPEIMLYRTDKNIEHLRANTESTVRTKLLFSLFDLVDDIVDKNETDQENQQERIESELRDIDEEEHQQTNMNLINQTISERSFIEDNALRKTTLMPGMMISGKLFFHFGSDIRKLTLTLPIGERLFELDFQCIKY